MRLKLPNRLNLRRRGEACLTPALLLLLCLIVLALGGCAQPGDPGAAAVKYLQARASADTEAIKSLSCSAWEGQAAAQADSFRSMQAKLDNVSCKQSGTDGSYTVVTCTGNIVTTYDGENRARPVPSYRMTQEDGEWKVCGEASIPASTPTAAP